MIASLVMLPLVHYMIMRQVTISHGDEMSQSINAGYYGTANNNVMN